MLPYFMSKQSVLCAFSVSKATAAECLEFMASGLYSELFTLIYLSHYR